MIELTDVHKRFGKRQVLAGLTMSVPKGMNFVLMGPMSRAQLMTLRKRMGYLFQNGALINWLSVFENVALPLREHARLPAGELDDRVHQVLRLVRLDDAAEQFPPSISGGMKLRAGLARALVTNPEYVLYDEPNAGLDPIIAREIHELIVRVRDELNVTGVIVTHSRACAVQCGDRIGILDQGKLGIEGTVDEMVHADHPLARAFLGGGAD
jgi:phospholipid/cholesterol/gamma-HCH transport system ATP-binding protein